MPSARGKRDSLFTKQQYWYHVSTTLRKKEVHLKPWSNKKGFNRSDGEPDGKRICVSPTIEQCITAIPYTFIAHCTIYRTKEKVRANKPKNIFDMHITDEGWIQEPTTFIKIGSINFEIVEKKLKVENVIPQAASKAWPHYSGKVLKWWKRARIQRFIKTA